MLTSDKLCAPSGVAPISLSHHTSSGALAHTWHHLYPHRNSLRLLLITCMIFKRCIIVIACNLFLVIRLVLLQLRRLPADSEFSVCITNVVFRRFLVHVRESLPKQSGHNTSLIAIVIKMSSIGYAYRGTRYCHVIHF